MKRDINRWVFQIPLSDVSTTDEDTTVRHCCFLCGKTIIGYNKHLVHYLTNGNLVSSDQNFENSQGFFPIGSECKNKLPNNFIFKP